MFQTLFRKKGITLDRLRSFVEVAEAGSVITAANRNIDHASKLSRDIAFLEDFFEFKLFNRRGRTLSELTEEGGRLRRIVNEYFGAMEELIAVPQQPVESLVIAGGETVLQWLVCAKLGSIRGRLPNTAIHLRQGTATQIMRWLGDGVVDLAVLDEATVLASEMETGRLDLGEMEYALFLTRELRDRHRGVSERQLLADLPLAGLEDFTPMITALQRELGTQGYPLNFAVTVTSFPQVAQVIRSGELAGFLPTQAADEMAQHGIEVLRHPLLEGLKVKLVLVYNARLARFRAQLAGVAGAVHEVLTA